MFISELNRITIDSMIDLKTYEHKGREEIWKFFMTFAIKRGGAVFKIDAHGAHVRGTKASLGGPKS